MLVLSSVCSLHLENSSRQQTEKLKTFFTKKTWVRKPAAALAEAEVITSIREKAKDLPCPDFANAPPWRPLLPNINHDWLRHPKAAYLSQMLLAECLSQLKPLIDSHEITIYTDGSVDPDTGAAGAAFVCGERQWRVSDEASSVQTEFVAIRCALEYAAEARPRNVVIATHSKASLQCLQNPNL